jgi:hypothetical protein
VERNKVSGLVWISEEATVISAHREVGPTRTQVSVGDVLYVLSSTPGEGGLYRIVKPRYGNTAKLVPIKNATVAGVSGGRVYGASV